MSTTRFRIQSALDRTLAIGLACLLAGTPLAFGGATWWAPAMIAGLTTLLVVAWLARAAVSGEWHILKSPLTGLGFLALGVAAIQSVPLPSVVARIVSPTSRSVHAVGMLPDLARADDPNSTVPEPISGRSPLTIDRSATLRWLGGASACLILFWIVSHHADRLDRLYLIWGSVIGAFLINTAIALIQIVGQAEGLYGFIEPGKGPPWAPTIADTLDAPGEAVLRPVGGSPPAGRAWLLPRPGRPRLLGTLMGGPGAHLALGSIGLPLALAVTLQLMAPRGSREGLWTRLAESGRGSLLVLLYPSTVLSAFMLGLLTGPIMAIPFGLAIIAVGIPSLIGTGLRGKGLILTALCLASLVGGAAVGDSGEIPTRTGLEIPRVDFSTIRAIWSAGLTIVEDFPLIGSGLGSFPSIYPYYKTLDASANTAMSSLLQWWVEAGAVGVLLLVVAGVWGLVRLPRAIRRVGSADRALAFGMVGAVVCFGLVSALHWTVELIAVALAFSAVAGTCNRWLAGGTDLFVERG